jgi:arsenate reductase
VFGAETIERFLHSSYDQFATASTAPNFLPLLAERFACQRLTVLASVAGLRTDARPVVLLGLASRPGTAVCPPGRLFACEGS